MKSCDLWTPSSKFLSGDSLTPTTSPTPPRWRSTNTASNTPSGRFRREQLPPLAFSRDSRTSRLDDRYFEGGSPRSRQSQLYFNIGLKTQSWDRHPKPG